MIQNKINQAIGDVEMLKSKFNHHSLEVKILNTISSLIFELRERLMLSDDDFVMTKQDFREREQYESEEEYEESLEFHNQKISQLGMVAQEVYDFLKPILKKKNAYKVTSLVVAEKIPHLTINQKG